MNAEAIYQRHLTAFKEGKIDVDSKCAHKFTKVREIYDYLNDGGIIPEMFVECAAQSLSPMQNIGFFVLLEFSSKQAEIMMKTRFILGMKRLEDHVLNTK